jgi:hypothetical protein
MLEIEKHHVRHEFAQMNCLRRVARDLTHRYRRGARGGRLFTHMSQNARRTQSHSWHVSARTRSVRSGERERRQELAAESEDRTFS